MPNSPIDSEWSTFIKKLETAEEEFVQGQPTAFLALWSHSDEVTLCGGFGGVERGWDNIRNRLTWVSAKYAEGTRTREEISSFVGTDFAYLVQREMIHSCVAGQHEPSTQALRATMVFRREPNGWRIVHRHANLQTMTQPPR